MDRSVFISYRGEDSHSYGALLFSELSRRFGEKFVFLDCESIPAGVDFVEEILTRVRSAWALLVIIGPRWLITADSDGRRRIDNPSDWIRRELAEAFAAGVRVIPILTEDVEIPTESALPADIAPLSRCQYRRLRHRDPTSDLARIVADLGALDPFFNGYATESEMQTGTANTSTTNDLPGQTSPAVPKQLPPPPRLFAGRDREMTVLDSAFAAAKAEGSTNILAICGTGGVGKSWLALHWAHVNLDQFPDGQLYVDLRGFNPSNSRVSTAMALWGFLNSFNVPADAIPMDLENQVRLYRRLVAGKRMLVLLDGARDTTHVEQLLPNSPSCTLLITSRHRLTSLVTAHGAQLLELRVLSMMEGRELLTYYLGRKRADADPDALTEVLACCAGLPLALTIIAAHALAHPRFPLAALADDLREASTRLDALDGGELTVDIRAVFSCSYRALDADAVRFFRLLGLASLPEYGLYAASSLGGLSISRTRMLLRNLENEHLIEQHIPGRYRMHELAQLYASEEARRVEPQQARDDALRRLADFYLHTGYASDRLLDPYRHAVELNEAAVGSFPQPILDSHVALAWFDTEYPCLLAVHQLVVEKGWHVAVWQLSWVLDTFHRWRGYLHNNLAVWRAGLNAASQLGEPAIRARAHRIFGHTCARVGEHVEAIDHLQRALSLARDNGDIAEQGHTHYSLAQVWGRQNDDHQALRHAKHALRFYLTVGNAAWEARALNSVGLYQAKLGYHQQAHESCNRAIALHLRHRNIYGEAATLENLGYIAYSTGQHSDAIGFYQRALRLRRALGNLYQEADTLANLGMVHDACRDHEEARIFWQDALHLYRGQHRTAEASRLQQRLAELDNERR